MPQSTPLNLTSGLDDERNSNADSVNQSHKPLKLPQLVKRHAIHFLDVAAKRSAVCKRKQYVPDYTVIENYASYPYIKYNKSVTDGYIREVGDTILIPSVINNICHQYCFIQRDGIFQLAYFVSRIASELGQFSSGFTGEQLIQHMTHRIEGFKSIAKEELSCYCNQLLRAKYIKPIAFRKGIYGGVFDTMLCGSSKYNVNSKKMKNVSAYTKFKRLHDRLAWNVGSAVEIRSLSSGWNKAQIVEVNKKKPPKVTVVFKTSAGEVLRKTVNRFDVSNIRSTTAFIETREGWNEGTEVEVYSHRKNQWFQGVITDIIIADEERSYVDHVTVAYCDDNDKTCSKSLARWSGLVRDVHSAECAWCAKKKFESGLRVWSKSQKRWSVAHVKLCIPITNCVIVKYGKHEKMLNITSDEIQIIQHPDA
eukprot:161978_1